MIRYFVSYYVQLPAGSSVRGCMEYHREAEISGFADVDSIARELEGEHGFPEKSLVVMNIQRFPI